MKIYSHSLSHAYQNKIKLSRLLNLPFIRYTSVYFIQNHIGSYRIAYLSVDNFAIKIQCIALFLRTFTAQNLLIYYRGL